MFQVLRCRAMNNFIKVTQSKVFPTNGQRLDPRFVQKFRVPHMAISHINRKSTSLDSERPKSGSLISEKRTHFKHLLTFVKPNFSVSFDLG